MCANSLCERNSTTITANILYITEISCPNILYLQEYLCPLLTCPDYLEQNAFAQGNKPEFTKDTAKYLCEIFFITRNIALPLLLPSLSVGNFPIFRALILNNPPISGEHNLCGLEPQLIKLEFIIYLPKLKVSRPSASISRLYFVWSLLKKLCKTSSLRSGFRKRFC
jgi:hypothetical protein